MDTSLKPEVGCLGRSGNLSGVAGGPGVASRAVPIVMVGWKVLPVLAKGWRTDWVTISGFVKLCVRMR